MKKQAKRIKYEISLRDLRKHLGIKQKALKSFKQASVSKIESRHDIKISTLCEYLKELNLDVVITAVKRDPSGAAVESYTLIKTHHNHTPQTVEEVESQA